MHSALKCHLPVSLFSLLAALFVSNYALAAEFKPVQDQAARYEFAGFSVQPPSGNGWYMRQEEHAIAFARQGSTVSVTHTIAASAERFSGFDPALVGYAGYDTKPAVFAAYAKKATEMMNPPDGGMQIIEHTAEPDSRFGYCVKEHAKFEDYASPVAPKVLIQEDWSYVCLHPDSVGVIVQMVFSERGLPGEQDASLSNVREQFFQSLKFSPLK